MAGEVYRLLCGGFDDCGGYFSASDHDAFWYGQVENYVPLLYDKIYYEKYLGDLIGENMIQWGVAGYSAVAMAGVFVLFSRKKKYLDLKLGFGLLNLFLLVRACAQWFLLCVQQVDLGLWDDDRVYFREGIS